jgi:cation transport regulator ChaB
LNRDLARLTLVVLLVASTFAVASTGTVAAADTCDFVSGPAGGSLSEPICDVTTGVWSEILGFGSDTDQGAQEIDGATSSEVASDAYSGAGSLKQGTDQIANDTRKFFQVAHNTAWSQSKVIIYEHLDNGSSEAEAKEAAREAVNDIYATEQKKLLDRATTISDNLNSTYEHFKGTANISLSDKYQYTPSNPADVTYFDTENDSYTLVNGEKFSYRNTEYNAGADDLFGPDEFSSYSGFSPDPQDTVQIKPVDSQLDPQLVVNGSQTTALVLKAEQEAASMRTDVETLASNTFSNYTQQEINASNYLSPADIASQYNLAANNGTAYSTAQAALRGYATNGSTSMTIKYPSTGTTVHGNLYADGQPPTTALNSSTSAWIPNHTYDVSQMNTTVYIAKQSGGFGDIQSDFKIIEMVEASTDEPLNYTVTETYTEYGSYSTNQSELLTNFAEALDERVASGSGGGLLGSGSTLVGLVLGILVLFMLVGGKEMFGDTVSNTLDRRAKSRRFQKKQNAKMRRTAYKEKKKDERKDD